MTKETKETKLVRFDWAMKNILRDKANFDILEGFLSAVLREDISVIELLESESNQSDFDKKFNRVDILVKDSQERQIIIEIQNFRESDYLERILWGASKLTVDTLELGEDYRNIKKVISISILYFYFSFRVKGKNDYIYYGSIDLKGMQTAKPFAFKRKIAPKKFKTFHAKDIFPEFYLIEVEHFQDVIKTDMDEWIYMLKHSAIRADFKSKNIDKASEKLTLLKMKPSIRQAYEKYVMEMVVERNVLETARNEGLQEGEQKGLEKGRCQEILKALQKMLKFRFGVEQKKFNKRLSSLNLQSLEQLEETVFTVQNLAEFEKALDTVLTRK
ncbi:PD-(D/E)XK nuclease family transposase [Candidatus Parabeggiatoa sp. HSG14]|uniref:PD-(D/E)XK nuclease family transposase n=1 Tax=Candidatus Parabeggiatoa sp. HSG14 TaxID=3055593 RepID=UPI0025A914BF|nr:PD-(D/E)XK nuclease family transposase [Thiotrichales bacterium HSG14]